MRTRSSHSFPVPSCAAQPTGPHFATIFRPERIIYENDSVSVKNFPVKDYSFRNLFLFYLTVNYLTVKKISEPYFWTEFVQPQLKGTVHASGFAFRFKNPLSNFGCPYRYLEISRDKRWQTLIFASSQSSLQLLTKLSPSVLCSDLVRIVRFCRSSICSLRAPN